MTSRPSNIAASPPDPMIGALLQNRYRVVRRLGVGGMGVVYEGVHVRINRPVAIKCLHATFAQNREVLARFHREALAATAIGNEHIVDVIDMDTLSEGTVFLVLEYLDGRDLGKELKASKRLSVARAIHIMSQLCEALAIAHVKEIVHRDLKPDNIYLITRGTDSDFVKILDFGISKFRDLGGPGEGLTDTGSMLGTPLYMAPEQFENTKTVDQRADIYALGGILFHCLTGHTPFEAKTLTALVGQVLHAPLPDLRTWRPDLPADLANVVARMLARHPGERFADCGSVQAALRPFAALTESADLPSVSLQGSDGNSQPAVTPPSALFRGTPFNAAPAPPIAAPLAAPTPSPTSIERVLARVTTHRAGLMLPIAGLALAAVLGVSVARLSSHHTPRSAPPRDPTPHDPVTPVAPPPNVVLPAPPPPPPHTDQAVREVHIRIHTAPAGAELYIDSHHINNPFDGEMPARDTPRRLEARLTGYRTVVIPDLVLEYPQSVEIPMTRGSGEERRATRAARGHGGNPPVVVATIVAADHATPTSAQQPPSPVAPPTVTAPPATTTPAVTVLPPLPRIRDPLSP
jgi:eukaryotic-like serine/threonine-protein kinase